MYPLIVKPYDGDGSRGLSLLSQPDDVDELSGLSGTQSLYLAQEFLETDGWDLKLYGIGARVWGGAQALAGQLRRTGAGGHEAD
jgi:glutathione synthase/RimK-type ligase-like ATP-grasp enzyme